MTATQTMTEIEAPTIAPEFVWDESQPSIRARRQHAADNDGIGFYLYVETDGRPEADVLADVAKWVWKHTRGGPVARLEDNGAVLAVYFVWGCELPRWEFPGELRDYADWDGSCFELWHERQVVKAYKRAMADDGLPKFVDLVTDW